MREIKYDLLKIINNMDKDIIELREKLEGKIFLLGAARTALYLDSEIDKQRAFWSVTQTISDKRIDNLLKKYEVKAN